MDEQKIIATNLAKNYVIKESALFGRKKKIVSAVKDITLEIPKGQIIGVLGINGAGKTTTIRMLASIIAPSSGTLTMNGVDAVKNHRWVKERINVISGGERNLYWRLTAIENLKYFGSLYGLSGVKLKEKIAELLKIVGLEEAEDIPVERYSKGMKQRLQIARGLINDPEYIFLDEPTLGLDIVIAKEIRTMIKELAQEGKKGVLLTTHYISEAEELCDYIYVLDKGRMIARGLINDPEYIFLDEPTLGLDIVIAKEIRTMIKELAQEGKKGVLLTTHYISEAEELCDYIYVLDKGRMIAQGTKEELKDLFASEPKMVLQEPGLEEILMKIIYRSRGEDSEENIFGNKSRN